MAHCLCVHRWGEGGICAAVITSTGIYRYTVKHEIFAVVIFFFFSILNFSREKFFCGFLTHGKVGLVGGGQVCGMINLRLFR